MKSVEVFTVSVSFVYRDEDSGMMTEMELSQEFVATSHCQAIDVAAGWAKNRYQDVIKDFYKESQIGCIKVGTKTIAGADENGQINTRRNLGFFEWKYDLSGTLEENVISAKRQFERVKV